MTTFTDEHATDLRRVRDQRGYDIGWAAACSCDWSGDLRDTHGAALRDLLEHCNEAKETTA